MEIWEWGLKIRDSGGFGMVDSMWKPILVSALQDGGFKMKDLRCRIQDGGFNWCRIQDGWLKREDSR